MHLGHTQIVTPDETIEDFRVNTPGVAVDMAHDAEVIGDDVTVGRDLEIALVHVGVEITVTQGVLQEQLQHPF